MILNDKVWCLNISSFLHYSFVWSKSLSTLANIPPLLELQEIERRRQKNKKRKEQKKRRAKEKQTDDNTKDSGQADGAAAKTDESAVDSGTGETPSATDDEDVEVEFVGQMPKIELQDPNYHYFTKIFQTFKVWVLFCLLNDVFAN